MALRTQIGIIDDDIDIVNLFSDVLTSSGFNTSGFNDPLAAIMHLRTHHNEFRLIITDLKMPEMDGKEIIKLISQMDNDIKLMLMSAYDLDLNELRQIRREDYIRKPVHIAQFIEAVKKKFIPVNQACVE